MKNETIADKARAAGIHPGVVYNRLQRGWTLAKALKEPVRKRKNTPVTRVPAVESGKTADGIIASAMIIAIVVTVLVALFMNA